jgi:CBS domain-containing protein
MITDECMNFFRKTPPYQFLDEAVLKTIAGNLSMEFFSRGSMILSQGGPPSSALRVIKKGGVKVYFSDEDETVLDLKSEGDSFGYLSLISGDKSRANVVAVEDTICYHIPKDIILNIINTEPHFGEYFMKSFFKNYLDRTYREMQDKNLLFKEGEKLLYTTPVGDILSRQAVTASENTSIREAADLMSHHRISSLILTGEQRSPSGIITDRDLRDKVVAAGLDTSRPVREIMTENLVTVEQGSTCFDALSSMIQHGIHHLLVTEGGGLKGVVTNHDFMLLQGTSPLSILKNIDRQKSSEQLKTIRDKIHQTLSILLKEGVKASSLLRIITELHDRLIQKIISLSIVKIGDSDCPFAFFVYGTEGRKEETFKTVFRCAIVYDRMKKGCEKRVMEDFSERLIRQLRDDFHECGLPMFETQPLGDKISIYGDMAEWEENILKSLQSENSEHVRTAKKMLDMRAIYGDISLVDSLKGWLYKTIRESERLRLLLIEYASRQRSPIGFFRKFVVEESGEHRDELDIKAKGIAYISDSLRAMAIVSNIPETSSVERLNLLLSKGIIGRELRNDIYAAYEFLLHLLLQSQLEKKERNIPVDNRIEPEKLTMLEKKTLKEVFQIVTHLQETVKQCLEHQEATA